MSSDLGRSQTHSTRYLPPLPPFPSVIHEFLIPPPPCVCSLKNTPIIANREKAVPPEGSPGCPNRQLPFDIYCSGGVEFTCLAWIQISDSLLPKSMN